MNIEGKIKQIEKKLRSGKESRVHPPILISQSGRNTTAEDEQKLGPKETWVTYKQQLQAGQEANAKYLKDNPGCVPKAIFIELDVDKEYHERLSNDTK